VKVLIEHGASTDKPTTYDRITPLFIAALKGHLEIVKVLIEHGVSIDQMSK
jgi:ankyrin repeat protein